jgi:hypothetical protein
MGVLVLALIDLKVRDRLPSIHCYAPAIAYLAAAEIYDQFSGIVV